MLFTIHFGIPYATAFSNYISFGIGSNKKPPGIDNSNYGGFLH